MEAEADEEAQLVGRPGDLNHLFLNLLDNAAKAAGPDGRIAVQGRVEGGHYVVRVGDSGPDVPDEDRDRIFEPFWTTRAPGEGTGLGLSIAQQVVHRHGGRIEVGTSALGGALLTVRVPGVLAATEVAAEPTDRLESSA